jgi:hypothetical protein
MGEGQGESLAKLALIPARATTPCPKFWNRLRNDAARAPIGS